MTKLTITLELRVPENVTPGAAAHIVMDFVDEQQGWQLDAASAVFPESENKSR